MDKQKFEAQFKKVEDKVDSAFLRWAFKLKDHPRTTFIIAVVVIVIISLAWVAIR